MTTFTPTQDQHRQAQECGNAAADLCRKPEDQAIAYRKAYDLTMRRFEIAAQRERLWNAAPKPCWFQSPVLTLAQIAEMETLCADTDGDTAKHDAEGRPW
jgi:hypothetical protein